MKPDNQKNKKFAGLTLKQYLKLRQAIPGFSQLFQPYDKDPYEREYWEAYERE